MMRLIFILLTSVACVHAQVGIVQQPIFSSPSSSELPAGIAFRWVASDLSDGSVAAWPDRIQSRYLVQATGANQPTKATNSVIFNGSQFLQATNPPSINTQSAGTGPATNYFMIIASLDTTGAPSRFCMSPGAPGATTDAWLWHGANLQWRVTVNNDIAPQGAAGKYLEYLCSGSNGTSTRHYTNGVLSVTAEGFNDVFSFLGQRADNTLRWLGTVKEIIIWTNGTGDVYMPDADIAQVHRYVTNAYGASIFQ